MTADDGVQRYAERMYPAPVDLGIAQPDRAVSNVRFGTTAYQHDIAEGLFLGITDFLGDARLAKTL